MSPNNRKLMLAVVATLCSPVMLMAATDNDNNIGGYNIVLISLIGLMLILLFVIGMLASTLQQLGMVIRDKNRKERSNAVNMIKTVFFLLATCIPTLHALAEAAGATAEKLATPVSNLISGINKNDFYLIISVITLELFVTFTLAIYISLLLKVISRKPELAAAAVAITQKSWFWDKFNAAATIEQEKDVLLDHNYDGIQELDNSLPPWWKYGFYLTIIVAIIYLYRYQVSHTGPSQYEEFAAEMQKGEEEKAAYLAQSANNVDENTVILLTDADEIAAGKEIFVKTCAPCHVADGGGNVGPNLTDEYWLHGGSIKDVFKSIKYGWQDKGMKSWKDDFSPKQIQELASFVKSLKGTHPAAPKAPQGDLYIDGTPGGAKTDSSSTGKVAAKQ